MRPLFVPEGQPVPAHCLIVDCGLNGAAIYSHWQDAPAAPPAIAADTSTEILLNAATDPATWLSGYSHVVNNHIDADGLLAMAIACDPLLAVEHRSLLIAAAEAGDFSQWSTEAGFRLMLVLHQHIERFEATGAKWEQRLCNYVVDHFSDIIALAQFSHLQRDIQIRRVLSVIQDIKNRTSFYITQSPQLIGVQWKKHYGHADSFRIVDREDDLPEWALSTIALPHQFQLLAMSTTQGIIYQLDAPRHSWARTVNRPTILWPNFSAVAQQLQQLEINSCQWQTLPASRKHGFVCQLASGTEHDLQPSSLPFETVWNTLLTTLTNGATGQ